MAPAVMGGSKNGGCYPPERGFADVVQLSQEGWIGLADFAKTPQKLPAADLLPAGFECDTVSLCGNSWALGRDA